MPQLNLLLKLAYKFERKAQARTLRSGEMPEYREPEYDIEFEPISEIPDTEFPSKKYDSDPLMEKTDHNFSMECNYLQFQLLQLEKLSKIAADAAKTKSMAEFYDLRSPHSLINALKNINALVGKINETYEDM